ncbi:MAG: TonB-dependent receptor [Candidatus Solibacter sp.]
MRHARLLLISLAAVYAVSTLNAQVAGRLSGSVVDPSGASVPGAKVSVFLQGGKEPVLTGTTNADGLFSFTAVRPDTYDVAVEQKGFNKAVVRQVKVAPQQEAALAQVKLEVMSATVSVEVTADVQAVQLSNAEVTSTITSTQVHNLPALGRQVSVLLQTQAGVALGSNTTSVNGLRSSFSNLTLDGINIQDNFIRTNGLDYAPMRTTIDQIEEITVSTSNADAAIGGGASQMVLSTKSGSNTYHGAAYWYNRNNALQANDWFNNQSGIASPKLNLNQVGASVSGYAVKDKLFFYVNPEVYRNKQESSRLRTVLTENARNGILTYRDAAGSVFTKPISSLRTFTADPTVKAMIAALPLPTPGATGAGDGLNNAAYRFNARSNEFRDQFVTKINYYMTPKNSFTGTYNYIKNPTDRPDQGAFYGVVPPVSNTIQDNMLSLAWRWTASPTLTNEVRGGFMRADTSFLDSNEYPKVLLSATNLLFSNPVNTFLEQGRKVNTYSVQDNANWMKGKHEISFGFQAQLLHVSPYNDAGIVPTYTLGISAANTTGIQAAELPGIRSTDLVTANNLYANLAGIVSVAAQTFNVTSTTSGFVPGATNLRELTHSTWAGYVQDKWKVRSNFTLTLGLRYEYWTPLDEKNSLFLAPRLQNNDARASVMDPNAVLDFIGKSSGRPFYNADKNNFAPNIGFAWDPFKGGKTSIRGGYMIAYVNDNVVATVRNSVTTSSGLSFGNTQSNLVGLLTNPPTVAAPAYKVPRTLQDNYAISTTSATGMPDPGLGTPFVQQWNFGIQREVKGAIVAVRYIGNKGSDLLRAIDYNQVLYNANGFVADFKRAQSNAGLAERAGLGYNGTYNASVPGSVPLTVFPLLGNAGLTSSTNQTYLRQGQVGELANQYMVNRNNGSVNFYTNPYVQGANVVTNGGESDYHAVQFELTKRTRSGFQGQFSYTFGKSLSNTAGDSNAGLEPLLDNANPQLEWARSPYDLRHVFKANYYYELPYGKGKRWSGNALLNTVLGNWAVSGIWSYQSGSPYSVISGYGTLNRSARSTSTNTASVNGTTLGQLAPLMEGLFMTGTGPYFISPTVIGSDGRGASQAGTTPFAGQLFFNPDPGTLGNLQRRLFTGPWQWSWDMAVKKSFRIKERHSVDLGLDLINWMNHPTFYVPPATGGDYGSVTNANINNATFGQISSMNYNPRVLQLSLYYRF